MFNTTKTLIVVYKDEILVNQLKKLVETNDDLSENEIVGTRDGSVKIVAWSEKVWKANKKAGNIGDKVLFLGDIKGSDSLIPVIDLKFSEHGVKFGWAGNQAIVYADTKEIANKREYIEFIKALQELSVPENIKQAVMAKTVVEETEYGLVIFNEEESKKHRIPKKIRSAISRVTDKFSKGGKLLHDKTEDLFRNKGKVSQQMLFYGIINMYYKGLEEFLNS